MRGDVIPPLSGTPEQLRTYFESAIRALKSWNRHHDFERLCIQHARLRFDPTIVEPTGPVSAGGDGGRDGWSSWVALDDGGTSTATRITPPGRMTTVVACTTSDPRSLSKKLRSDVKKILSGIEPCGRIIFYSAESLSAAQWRKAVDRLDVRGVEIFFQRPDDIGVDSLLRGSIGADRIVELVIVSGMQLADDCSRPEFAAVAVDVLRLPPALLPARRSLEQIHALTLVRASASMGRRGDSPGRKALDFESDIDRALKLALSREGLDEELNDVTAGVADADRRWAEWLPTHEADPEECTAQLSADRRRQEAWRAGVEQFRLGWESHGNVSDAESDAVRAPGWANRVLKTVEALLECCIDAIASTNEALAGCERYPQRRRGLLQLVSELYVLEDVIGVVRWRLQADASGVMLIEGGWGTGKTFHTARMAIERVHRGAPTVFANGRDWKGSNRRWLIELASTIDSGISGAEFLGALRLHAEVTGHRAVIVVDAANEASLENWRVRIEQLAADIETYPEISLVVTRRNDDGTQDLATGDSSTPWAVYRHDGVDPAYAWDILRGYFDLPPVAVPWTIPDYQRPLVLRMFARVCQGNSERVVAPLALGHLFTAWVATLTSEFAEQREGTSAAYDRGELDAVLKHVDNHPAPGPTREQIRLDCGGLSSSEIDMAIDFLCYEGVLVQTDGRLQYGLQRIAEFRQAQKLLTAGQLRSPSAPKDRYTGEKWTDPDPITVAMAQIAPAFVGREVLTTNYRGWHRGLPEAFALSLLNRAPSTVTAATMNTARKLLRFLSSGFSLWTIALQNSVIAGHPIGARFIDQEVSSMAPRQRATCWTGPLQSMMNIGGEERDCWMAEILLWIDRQANEGKLPPEHLGELARMLMWCLTLPPGSAATSFARTLTSVFRAHPESVADVLSRAHVHLHHDPDVYCGVWNAVYGAIVREGSTHISKVLAETARAHFRSHHTSQGMPTHLRLHSAVYRALRAADHALDHGWSGVTLHEFLRENAWPIRTRLSLGWRAVGNLEVGEVDRHLLDDYRRFVDPHGYRPDRAMRRAAQIFGEVAVRNGLSPFRRQLAHPMYAVNDKVRDQARQMWIGELALNSRYLSGLHFDGGDYVPPDPGSGQWLTSREALDGLCDTSVSLDVVLCHKMIGCADQQSIPFGHRLPDFGNEVPSITASDYGYLDAEGGEWWLVAGEFNLDERTATTPHHTGPLLRGLEKGFRFESFPSVRLPRRRNLHVSVRSWLVHDTERVAETTGIVLSDFAAAEWETVAEMLTCSAPDTDTGVVATGCRYQNPQRYSFELIVPTAHLRSVLNINWTGEGVTCADSRGGVIKADSKPGSYQLPYLSINRDLMSRISELGYGIVWEMRVTDYAGTSHGKEQVRRSWRGAASAVAAGCNSPLGQIQRADAVVRLGGNDATTCVDDSTRSGVVGAGGEQSGTDAESDCQR